MYFTCYLYVFIHSICKAPDYFLQRVVRLLVDKVRDFKYPLILFASVSVIHVSEKQDVETICILGQDVYSNVQLTSVKVPTAVYPTFVLVTIAPGFIYFIKKFGIKWKVEVKNLKG